MIIPLLRYGWRTPRRRRRIAPAFLKGFGSSAAPAYGLDNDTRAVAVLALFAVVEASRAPHTSQTVSAAPYVPSSTSSPGAGSLCGSEAPRRGRSRFSSLSFSLTVT